MPGDNNQSNDQNQSGNQGAGSGDNSQTQGKQNTQGDEGSNGETKNIPYARFSEVNSKYKEAKDKLAAYEAKEKAEADKKLLDEKKYQELIGTKDKEIEALKSSNSQILKDVKTKEIEFKVSSVLAKNNVIDASDGLKFVKYDDLLESDDIESEINKRVADLVKNKSYLFKSGGNSSQRSGSENFVPGNNQKQGNDGKPKSASENVLHSLAEKFRQS